MSTTVDQRVVEMRFDNKQFENNVQTSLSTLDKLKQSLNLTGASKGLENVSEAASKCNMSGISSAVETVHSKFTALEVMAVTALANITNSAVNAGKKIVLALTIDPIKTGFNEYELKMGSIQTIMASTGESIETVNRYLAELNTYSDKTIYSFSDMTSNIGKFTNAGVKLEDAVSAIKGISNEAAVSGANANEASRAMYNFAQALSAGYVKLIDWKSIENANMATVEFKNQLLETALAVGTVVKVGDKYRTTTTDAKGDVSDLFNATSNFNEALSNQWMTTDVLVQTLGEYADETTKIGKKAYAAAQEVKTFSQLFDTLKEAAQSGWATTWETVVGDFEEAKVLLSDINNIMGKMIGDSADARNAVLSGWKDGGGRVAVIDALENSFKGILSIIAPIKEAFTDIFPPITSKQLIIFSETLRDLTSHLKLSDETSANLKSTFKGLFAVLDIARQAFSAVFKAVSPLFGGLGELTGGILGVTASLGDWLVKLRDTIETTDVFNNVMQGIVGFIKAAKNAVGDFIQIIKEKIVFPGFELLHSFLDRIHERMSGVGEAAGKMKGGVTTAVDAIESAVSESKFLQALQLLWDGIKSIVGGIIEILGGLASEFAKVMGDINFNSVFDIIGGLSLGGISVAIVKFLKSVREPLESFTNILDGVRGCFEAYQTQLKAGALFKIAGAIAILTAAILVISLIDSDKLAASLGAITVLFADLMASMAIFGKISGNLTGVFKTCTAMISISIAVLILASALKKISGLNLGEMATGLVGIVGLTTIMVAAAKIMGSSSTTIIKGATQMVIFAAAIKILASACEELSKLNWSQLTKGLVGVGVLLAEVGLFMNTAKFSGKSITTATGIVILSASIKILASACADFSEMKWESISKGLVAIGILLSEIAVFTKLTGNAQHVISTGIALIAIVAAMKILASALTDFNTMQWDEIGRGLTAMAGALLSVILAVNFIPKNMIGIGIGLITVSTALVILATALDKMGDMQWDEIGRGLTVLGGSMAILAVGLKVMTGTLSGSAAMLIAAAALAVLTPILSILGAMSWEAIAKGLVSIAGAFTVIGVAGLVLTSVLPTILGLGGAFALIGVGVLGIGVGLLAAGAGLSALAVGFTALAASVAAGATGITAALVVIITGVVGLIPVIIAKIGEGIIELCKVIVEGAPAIGEAVKAIVLSLVKVLVECVPAIADGALELIAGVLASLAKYTPQIVDSIFQFLIGLLEGIARNVPGLIKAAIDVLMSFFSGVVDALSGIDVDVLLKGIAGIGLISAIMLALAATAVLAPLAMIGVLAMGVVIAELALVLAAIGNLAQIPGLTWLIGEGGKLLKGIGTAIGSFIGGIVGGFMGGISSQFPKIGDDLSAFMKNIKPFVDGAKQIDASAMEGVKALAEVILILTAANILEGLTSWFTGGSSLSKFGEELIPFGHAMKKFSLAITGIDGDAVSNTAIAGKTMAEMAAALPNKGGVVGFFAGENDMKDFGDQLIPFGKAIKDFSLEVTGLDAGVVTNAATAGKALAELADALPNTGGVVGWFAGNNDMAAFASQLVPFGKAMRDYSIAVTGIGIDAITNSTIAGKALVELADNLPNTGGMVSWFTGDNDMGAFGESLVSFGQNFASYSNYMNGVNSGIVTTTTNAASSIVALQKSLPKDGGWFSDDTTLAEFGSDISSFGYFFNNFYSHISGINTSLLAGVITQTNNLVAMAKGMESINTSVVSSFGQALTTLGQNGITGFINSFTNANSRVTNAAVTMMTTFINGVNLKKEALTTTFIVLVNASLNVIKNKYREFQTTGEALMVKFVAGIRSKESSINGTFAVVLSSALTEIKNKYNDFYNAGRYLVEGFAAGIADNAYLAEMEAQAMADAAVRGTMNELDEHSPSKVGYRIGDFFGLGFVNAISDYTSRAYKASAGMAESAKSGLSKAISKVANVIDGNIDTQPTIRPVLDLSDVEFGTRRLNALFSRNQAMSISTSLSKTTPEEIQNEGTASDSSSPITFTQYNYSPKALSRLEIYRQTKNQLSTMKGLVKV